MARQSLARQLSASCEHGKEVLLATHSSSRDLDLCMSWRSSGLIVEQSREHHQVRIFCTHVPPTDTFVCMCLLENKTAAKASWISVLFCVNIVLHASQRLCALQLMSSIQVYLCCAVLCCVCCVVLCMDCCLFLDRLDLSYTFTRYTVLQSLQRLLPLCHL